MLALVPAHLVGAVPDAAWACASAPAASTPRRRTRWASARCCTATSRSRCRGALGGLAGAFLVTVASSIYREGQTGGRGFIGMATVVFGNWMAVPTAIGAFIFGFTDALRTRQEATVGALLLVAAIAFVMLAVVRGRHRGVRMRRGWGGSALWCQRRSC